MEQTTLDGILAGDLLKQFDVVDYEVIEFSATRTGSQAKVLVKTPE
jgi:hypothetical protein